jgi:hypothetical protein
VGSFDLVSAHFMHLPERERVAIYRDRAAAVAPGGTLLLVGHHPDSLPSGAPRPHLVDMLFTAEQLVAELDLDGWDVQVADERHRRAIGPDGDEVAVSDAILRVRRA